MVVENKTTSATTVGFSGVAIKIGLGHQNRIRLNLKYYVIKSKANIGVMLPCHLVIITFSFHTHDLRMFLYLGLLVTYYIDVRLVLTDTGYGGK